MLTNNSSRGGGGQTSNITQLASFIPFLSPSGHSFTGSLCWALPPGCTEHKDSWAPGDALNTATTSRQDKASPVSQPCLNPCLKWKEQALINITAVSRQQRILFKTQPVATRAVKYSTPCHVQPDFNATQSPAPKKAHSRDEAPSLCSKRWLFSTWLLAKEGTSDSPRCIIKLQKELKNSKEESPSSDS